MRLVRAIRAKDPKVRIVLRGDSGFCRWRLMKWCDRHGVDYLFGLAKNSRLNRAFGALHQRARKQPESTGVKARLFGSQPYAAKSWDKARRVIAKAEHTAMGGNPRYVVTSLPGEDQELYDQRYCARGEMENRIKEQQLGLWADRTSCHNWWANQFRLLLSGFAYVLLEAIWRIALPGTELARAQVGTLRLKLLKIGAAVLRNTRRIRVLLSSAYPYRELFMQVHQAFAFG